MMTSDLVTPSAEQCYLIIFTVKEKVKPAEILPRLNARYRDETMSHASIYDGHIRFFECCKEVQDTAISWQYRTIREKRPGKLTKKVILLHGNTCPHMANLTKVTLATLG
jgi:hypothetical protein